MPGVDDGQDQQRPAKCRAGPGQPAGQDCDCPGGNRQGGQFDHWIEAGDRRVASPASAAIGEPAYERHQIARRQGRLAVAAPRSAGQHRLSLGQAHDQQCQKAAEQGGGQQQNEPVIVGRKRHGPALLLRCAMTSVLVAVLKAIRNRKQLASVVLEPDAGCRFKREIPGKWGPERPIGAATV